MGAGTGVEASDWSERAERLRGAARGELRPGHAPLPARPRRRRGGRLPRTPSSCPGPTRSGCPKPGRPARGSPKPPGAERPIMIHGDYDVDGLMGTAVLMGGLKSLGAKVEAFVPSRFDGGYGLSETSLEAVKRARCRPAASPPTAEPTRSEIGERLRDAGIDLIVTDHHLPDPGERPPGIIVNPKADAGHPDRELCGAAVALQVLRCTADQMGKDLPLEPFLRLVAIATVADVVPITAVNRKICKAGFQALEHTPNPGLALLLEDILRMGPVRSHHISYHIAPRFNAAGRMEDARLVLDLLLERDPAAAARLKGRLESLNDQRKSLPAGGLRGGPGAGAAGPAGEQGHRGRLRELAQGDHRTRGGAPGGDVQEIGLRALRRGRCGRGIGPRLEAGQRDGRPEGGLGPPPALRRPQRRRGLLGGGGQDPRTGAPARGPAPIVTGARARGNLFPHPAQPAGGRLARLGPPGPLRPRKPRAIPRAERSLRPGQKTMSGGHLAWEVGVSPSHTVQFIAWNGESAGLGPSSLAPSRTIIGRPAPQQRPGPSPYYFNVTAIL